MASIDLVWLGAEKDAPAWTLGRAWHTAPKPEDLSDTAVRLLENSSAGAVLFWSEKAGPLPDQGVFEDMLGGPAHLWHAGLAMGTGGHPSFIDYVAPTWMLARDPDPNTAASSWRLTFDALLTRTQVLQAVQFDASFQTIEMMGLDFGFRCARAGVIARHEPNLVSAPRPSSISVPTSDQFRFVYKGWGRKWAAWAALRAVLHERGRAKTVRSFLQTPAASSNDPDFDGRDHDRPTSIEAETVSVLIPTLGRYGYLDRLLAQLATQTLPPHEVVVVDQNENRRDNWTSPLPLKVLTLDRPGQSTARNLGVEAASGRWLLFLDDDDEVSDDIVERHLQAALASKADASCGVVDEIGALPRGPEYRRRRISDVFPTNNTLALRSEVIDAGLFDTTLDGGQKEDHELGIRMYLRGALLLQQPDIPVLHHHAPQGGLRHHGSRVTTYGGSRLNLLQRNLPTPSDFYVMLKHHSARQVRETRWIYLLGALSARGARWRRSIKLVLGVLLLPHSYARVRGAERNAEAMLGRR